MVRGQHNHQHGHIEPGSPWENGFAESFNGRFRHEFLNTELFTTAPEAQLLADRWRWECNTLRLHSALQGRSLLEASQQGAAACLRPPTLISTGPIKGITSPAPKPESWQQSPNPGREQTRTLIAVVLALGYVLLIVRILACVVCFMVSEDDSKDLTTLLIATYKTLLGSALGSYFGGLDN
jgi:hypothetical protein